MIEAKKSLEEYVEELDPDDWDTDIEIVPILVNLAYINKCSGIVSSAEFEEIRKAVDSKDLDKAIQILNECLLEQGL